MASDVELVQNLADALAVRALLLREAQKLVGEVQHAAAEEIAKLRASEAALSKRVGHIAQALGVVVDRIDADQYDTKAAIARDIIAALRPPTKPETP